MDDRIKKLLTEQRHKLAVNKNSQMSISLDSNSRPLPANKLNETVNVGEQFDLERQTSSKYRFYGNIKSLVSNPLFNDNIKLFQRTDDQGVIQTKSVDVDPKKIVEQDGWFGYFDDDSDTAKEYIQDAANFNDNKSTLCELFPFDPGPDRLKFDDPDGLPNYSLKITYPHSTQDMTFLENTQGVSLKDGIPVVETEEKIINERSYSVFKTPINHGLGKGDIIRFYHMGDLTYDTNRVNDFQIIELGDVGGLNKDRSFVIDSEFVDSEAALVRNVSTVKRVVNDVPSDYYVRTYKSITTSKTDYDLFPASYATTMYGDEEVGFNFKTDVDVGDLRDNLGRPLSEIFLTICKLGDEDNNNNDFKDQYWFDEQAKSAVVVGKGLENNFWTEKCGGFKTDNYEGIRYNVRAISSDEEIKGEDFGILDNLPTCGLITGIGLELPVSQNAGDFVNDAPTTLTTVYGISTVTLAAGGTSAISAEYCVCLNDLATGGNETIYSVEIQGQEGCFHSYTLPITDSEASDPGQTSSVPGSYSAVGGNSGNGGNIGNPGNSGDSGSDGVDGNLGIEGEVTPVSSFCGIKCEDGSFIGDISEYNSEELNERMIEPIYHRFNSVYREYRKSILGIDEGVDEDGLPNYGIDDLREGYLYRPHYRIKIREFSSYIESGDAKKVIGIPDYATLSYSGDTGETEMYRWRDFLDIGFYDELGKGVDYPFLSGAHYLYLSTRFYLERQDPPCKVNVIQEELELSFPPFASDPSYQKFKRLTSDPRFYDYLMYVDGVDEEISTNSDDFINALKIKFEIILIDYDGEYSLGNREIPGDCIELPLIDRIDLDDVC